MSSASDLIKLIELYEEDGGFTDDSAALAIKLHLKAASHYEDTENAEKVVKHLKGLKKLFDYRKRIDLISVKMPMRFYRQVLTL